MAVGALFLAGSAAAERIFHDAGLDLVANTSNRNTWTNEYGGVWYYQRSDGITVTPGHPRILLDTLCSFTDYLRGPSRAGVSPQLPYIVVNRGVSAISEILGAAMAPLDSCQLLIHPANYEDGRAAVLGFRVPRAGEYAVEVSGACSVLTSYGTGDMVVALVTNNVVSAQSTLMHRSAYGSVEYNVTNVFARGDLIEFVVHRGEDLDSDCFRLNFRITETADVTVVNPALALQKNVNDGTNTNPWDDLRNGEWQGYYAASKEPWATQYDMKPNYYRSTQGAGLKGVAQNANSLPYIAISPSDSLVEETGWWDGVPLRPGEVYAHPNSVQPAVLVYRPSESGVYDIGLVARDIAWTSSDDGVELVVRRDDEVLGQMYVYGKTTDYGVTSSDSLFIEGVDVARGRPIEIVLTSGPSNVNSSDGTCYKLVLVKRGNGKVYDCNAAMASALGAASPVSSFQYGGATWDCGLCVYTGSFSAFSQIQQRWDSNSPNFKAFGNNTYSSPFMGVNLSGGDVDASKVNGNPGLVLYKDGIFSHPQMDGKGPALRFHAPCDGVYSAHGSFSHIVGGKGYGGNDQVGNDIHIVVTDASDANRAYPANGYVHRNNYPSSTNPVMARYIPNAQLVANEVYLRAGEIISFVIGTAGAYEGDLNEFTGYVMEEATGAAVKRRINIDIDGGAGAGTFSGRGRIGYSNDTWNSVKVSQGVNEVSSRQLMLDDATRAGTTLTLAKAGGISASVDGSEANLLFKDGATSSGTADQTTYTIAGLKPHGEYDLYFHCRANGLFTANGLVSGTDKCWTNGDEADHAVIVHVFADYRGEISGTFCSSDATTARWAGLQIAGSDFASYAPTGTIVILF